MSVDDPRFKFQTVELKDNPDPEFQVVIDYWNGKKERDFAPPWESIDLMDFPPAILPNCIIVDIHKPFINSTYRFFGTGLVNLHGFELTKRTIGEIEPHPLRIHIIEQYEIICKLRKPLIFATEFIGRSGQIIRDLMLRLPLSNDSLEVTNIISFESFGDYSLDLQDIYAAMSENTK